MRLVLLAALLAGCGMGFDGEPDPETVADCEKLAAQGYRLVEKSDGFHCEAPATGAYVAAKLASASAGDAGAHD